MPLLLIVLLLGVLAFGWWRWRYTSLSRLCRWRQDRAAGDWACAACGKRTRTEGNRVPTVCLRKN